MSGTASTITSPSSLQHDAEDAVRAGMVRAEVEEHEVRILAGALHSPLLGPRTLSASSSAACLSSGKRNGSMSVARAGWSLRKRMALPGGRHQNPPQVGMAVKPMPNMSHVSRSYQFAAGKRRTARRDGEDSPREGRYLDAEVLVPLEGEQMVDDGEVALGLARPVRPLRSSIAVRS